MKMTALLIILAIAVMLPHAAYAKKKKSKKVAHVLVPFIPIYRERAPESEIVIQASKGDRFPVKRVGKYWVEVLVPPNNEPGWIELGMENPKVEIIASDDKSHLIMNIVYLAIFLIVVALAIYFVRFYSEAKRKKALENIESQ